MFRYSIGLSDGEPDYHLVLLVGGFGIQRSIMAWVDQQTGNWAMKNRAGDGMCSWGRKQLVHYPDPLIRADTRSCKMTHGIIQHDFADNLAAMACI